MLNWGWGRVNWGGGGGYNITDILHNNLFIDFI